MSRYSFTCLTPLLIGDGSKLAPIDYMVWRDQVNVLDQMRIFRLLAKGPRLDSYLAQIRRADKLDFASWGGYAQNFALRRIPLESPDLAKLFERARPDDLSIPTFATTQGGVYLPASALKGPLRTGLVIAKASEAHFRDLAARTADGPVRRAAGSLETAVLGNSASVKTRALLIADSAAVSSDSTRIYLLRTATLAARGSKLELGWKTSPRGAVDGRRVNESTPTFAEMAVPGTVFEGAWNLNSSLSGAEALRALRWKSAPPAELFTRAANRAAGQLLALQMEYAERAALPAILDSLKRLQRELEDAEQQPASCLLCAGWGTGYLAKSVLTASPSSPADVLRNHPVYSNAISTGLPFPKTRRMVFLNGEPAALPGWGRLDLISRS